MASKMTQMSVRMADLEKHNNELLDVQDEDKRALANLDHNYRRALADLD